jgi:carbon-monoxide dehydrogenase small subunit
MALHVRSTINGQAVEFLCEPDASALEEGCNSGDCGSCSVLLDGTLVCSCLVLGAELEGRQLVTVEGVATGSELHPVQQKLLEHNALQCGICIPGIVVAAKALLDQNPDPDETTVRFALAGNLCRCTGYDKIIRAVLDAAATMRESAGGRA